MNSSEDGTTGLDWFYSVDDGTILILNAMLMWAHLRDLSIKQKAFIVNTSSPSIIHIVKLTDALWKENSTSIPFIAIFIFCDIKRVAILS